MKMKWSEKETYRFCKLYLNHECLWNVDDAGYKDNRRRLMAYKELIVEMNELTGILLSVPEVKTKIRSLKSTYCQEQKKIRNRSTSEWTYQPNMKWFALWHNKFKSGIKRFPDRTSFEANQDSSDETCQKMWVTIDNNDEDEETMEEEILEEETLDPFPEHDDEAFNAVMKADPQATVLLKKETRYPIKKKKIKRERSSTESSDRPFRENIDNHTAQAPKEDEFDIYGKYIASQLRQMGLQKALRVQLEIQTLVSEARISDFKSEESEVIQ